MKQTVFGTDDLFDIPVEGLTTAERATFRDGDGLFDLALRPYDGLGPLYTRTSCSACHDEGVRGPGLVQKMVVVEADGITPAADQSKLPYGHTVHPLMAAGAHDADRAARRRSAVKVTIRLGPPILGRGYLEAVLDSEIERVAAAAGRSAPTASTAASTTSPTRRSPTRTRVSRAPAGRRGDRALRAQGAHRHRRRLHRRRPPGRHGDHQPAAPDGDLPTPTG